MSEVSYIPAEAVHAEAVGEIIRGARLDMYSALNADNPGYIDAMHDDMGGYGPFMPGEMEGALYARVALVDSEAVGVCTVDATVDNDRAHLSYLFIDPGHHRKGIGASMLVDAEKFAVDEGYDHMSLMVFEGNVGAIALYKSFGYQTVGVKEDTYYGSIGPGLKMQKNL